MCVGAGEGTDNNEMSGERTECRAAGAGASHSGGLCHVVELVSATYSARSATSCFPPAHTYRRLFGEYSEV